MSEPTTAGVRGAVLRLPGARRIIANGYRLVGIAGERRRRKAIELRDEATLKDLAGRTDLRLNVGSSSNHLPGWLSIDIRPDEVCFGMDAAKPWPFESGSAEAINSEHFIEHLTPEEGSAYLREAYRVLRPGGLIRTTTPDLSGICRTYLDRDPRTLQTHRSHGYEAATHGDMVNNYFYSWDHRHIYDFESLSRLLAEAGFRDIEQAGYGRSTHDLLAGIDRHDPDDLVETVLCVDASKPV